MTSRTATTRLGLVILVLLTLPIMAQAGTKMTYAVHVDAYQMQGQQFPAHDDTATYWLSGDQVRVDQADTASFIFKTGLNELLMLNHKDNSYTQVPIGAFEDIIMKQAEGDSAAMAQAQGIMQMMHMKTKVTPTEETQKIGDYSCTKYVMEVEIAMTTSETTIWATEDVDVNSDLVMRASQAIKAFLPGFDEAAKEMQKIKGLPVKSATETTVMGVTMKNTSELLSIDKGVDIAGSKFKVPEGYSQTQLEMPGMN